MASTHSQHSESVSVEEQVAHEESAQDITQQYRFPHEVLGKYQHDGKTFSLPADLHPGLTDNGANWREKLRLSVESEAESIGLEKVVIIKIEIEQRECGGDESVHLIYSRELNNPAELATYKHAPSGSVAAPAIQPSVMSWSAVQAFVAKPGCKFRIKIAIAYEQSELWKSASTENFKDTENFSPVATSTSPGKRAAGDFENGAGEEGSARKRAKTNRQPQTARKSITRDGDEEDAGRQSEDAGRGREDAGGAPEGDSDPSDNDSSGDEDSEVDDEGNFDDDEDEDYQEDDEVDEDSDGEDGDAADQSATPAYEPGSVEAADEDSDGEDGDAADQSATPAYEPGSVEAADKERLEKVKADRRTARDYIAVQEVIMERSRMNLARLDRDVDSARAKVNFNEEVHQYREEHRLSIEEGRILADILAMVGTVTADRALDARTLDDLKRNLRRVRGKINTATRRHRRGDVRRRINGGV